MDIALITGLLLVDFIIIVALLWGLARTFKLKLSLGQAIILTLTQGLLTIAIEGLITLTGAKPEILIEVLFLPASFAIFYWLLKKFAGARWPKSLSLLISWSVLAAIIIVILGSIMAITGYQNFQVFGKSMEPTYKEGDNVLVRKFSNDFQRSDQVVYKRKDESPMAIGTIIGLPGEEIEIRNNTVFINGSSHDEPFRQGTMADFSVKLRGDQYFVLPDNRQTYQGFYDGRIVTKDRFAGEVWGKSDTLTKYFISL